MNLNYLIDKYGTLVYQNENKTKWFLDDVDKSYLNIKIKRYSSIDYKKILLKNAIEPDDVFKDSKENEYLVFDIKEIYKKENLIYSEAVVFKNDFDKEITIIDYNTIRAVSGTPKEDRIILATKARIKELSPSDPLSIPTYPDGAQITHLISIFYDAKIKEIRNLIIKWDSKEFEVKKIENVNNMNKILVFYCQKSYNIL